MVGLKKSAALAAVCDFGVVAAEYKVKALPAALDSVDKALEALIQAVRDEEAAKRPVVVTTGAGHA